MLAVGELGLIIGLGKLDGFSRGNLICVYGGLIVSKMGESPLLGVSFLGAVEGGCRCVRSIEGMELTVRVAL